jgi:hypothetical protein
MPTVYYSIPGWQNAYWVPCEVLDRFDGRYLIEYHCPLFDEKQLATTTGHSLRFPSYSELVY